MIASGIGDAHSHRLLNNTVANTAMPSSKGSDAQVAQNANFPKKEQAIVTDAVESLSIKEYTITIGRLIGPSNIRFVSRISHGRVCLYLSSQAMADKFLDIHKKINVNNHTVEFRPLVSKAKRVILSNVWSNNPTQM